MKLLFTKRAYARVGGSESLAYQFATRLASRGHDVRVVCAQAFDDRRVFTNEGVEIVQVKPRGGFLGSFADASTLVDLMRTDVLAPRLRIGGNSTAATCRATSRATGAPTRSRP